MFDCEPSVFLVGCDGIDILRGVVRQIGPADDCECRSNRFIHLLDEARNDGSFPVGHGHVAPLQGVRRANSVTALRYSSNVTFGPASAPACSGVRTAAL